MAFFKFRSNGQKGNEARNVPASSPPAESVEAMRRRARHRLLGAAVLVLLGVIGFPILFDTQPRPVSVDIPIEIPDRGKSKPLAIPQAAPAAVESAAKPEPDRRVAQASSSSTAMITENADGSEVTTTKPVAAAKPEPKPEAPKPEPKPEPKKPEVKAEAKPEPKKPDVKAEAKVEHKPDAKPEAKPAPKTPASDDGARARALLDGSGASAVAAKPAAASDDAGRFVVQVGAFSDAGKAREVRQKLEKAGLKTYTNVAKTADGERTRVRVGPFASRADADKAAGKIKDLSLPAAVLTL